MCGRTKRSSGTLFSDMGFATFGALERPSTPDPWDDLDSVLSHVAKEGNTKPTLYDTV